jgi:transcription antitermination factor NusG
MAGMLEPTMSIPQTISSTPPEPHVDAKWYAAYTWAHHEKRVAEQLRHRQISSFLPLYRSIHRWKDRRKEVELALLPSYVFVQLVLKDRVRVLEIPGVVHIVSAGGVPVPLAEHEIESLRRGMEGSLKMEPHPYLQPGRRVRVRSGPMAGLEGILLRRKEGLRLVVSIEILMRAVAVEIDEADVRACL